MSESTPVGRMTRSRAKGISTPLTSLPMGAAKKAATAAARAGSKSAVKATKPKADVDAPASSGADQDAAPRALEDDLLTDLRTDDTLTEDDARPQPIADDIETTEPAVETTQPGGPAAQIDSSTEDADADAEFAAALAEAEAAGLRTDVTMEEAEALMEELEALERQEEQADTTQTFPEAAATPEADPAVQQQAMPMGEQEDELLQEMEEDVTTLEDPPSPPASPVQSAPKVTFVSKTPGPEASTPLASAKTPLTAVKPSAGTPQFSQAEAAGKGTDGKAGSTVRFVTPATPEVVTTPHLKGANPATLKSALRPSSTFSTPGAGGKKTADASTAGKSGKRVSISTPVNPKSTSAPRHIVKTPYPRSGGRKVLADEDDISEEEDIDVEADQVMDAAHADEFSEDIEADETPAADTTIEAEATLAGDPSTLFDDAEEPEEEADTVADVTTTTEMLDITMALAATRIEDDAEELPEDAPRSTGDSNGTRDAQLGCDDVPSSNGDSVNTPLPKGTAPTAKPTPSPAPMLRATPSPLPVGARPTPSPAAGGMTSNGTRASATPISLTMESAGSTTNVSQLPSAKRAQAHAALKSLARAENTYAANAQRSGTTPVSGTGSNVPSYMAPTAAALSKAKAAPRLKSVAVVPEEQDNTSVNQLRKHIKEAAAKKATGSASYTQTVKMNEIRKHRLIEKAGREETPEPEEPEDAEAKHDPAAEAMLAAAMTKLEIAKPKPKVAPLKGVPVPQGKHTHFTKKGKAVESPSNTKPVLRGVAPATGTHIRFRD